MSAVYCALVHHPVLDRMGATATTAVTNLDVHDLARLSRTYALKRYFVVTPIAAQRALVAEIVAHWTNGSGRERIPERGEALQLCEPIASIEDACDRIAEECGARPRIIGTAARTTARKAAPDYGSVASAIRNEPSPFLLLFGTGHGLASSLLERVDIVLPPIRPGEYNHLSVRCAAAITFDRLFGETRHTE